MDPVTGIGLAASIIQLVHFGIDTTKTCRELCQQGSTSEHININDTANHLAHLTSSLQQSIKQVGPSPAPLPKEDRDLLDLGRKCEDCAIKLQHELGKYQVHPQVSTFKAVSKGLRAVLKRERLVKLQDQLETYRKLLETSLLYQLSQRFDAQTLSINTQFAAQDQNLKHIVQCLANAQTSFKDLLKEESKLTREHLEENLNRLERLHIDEYARKEEELWYKEMLQSLFFSEIASRQEQIEESFDGIDNSYDWIFDEPSIDGSEKAKRANFLQWLKSGNEIFWINGKAGSGKSALMSHICNHSLTRSLLKEWSADRQLLTPKFFFWSTGTREQKTVNGLLRSLLFQILKDCPRLISCFQREPLCTWTEKRLLSALSALITQTEHSIRICLFIDGLDEFDGPHDTVVTILAQISSREHVKICLSSRPLINFEKAFAGMPALKLQEHTFDSLHTYANSQLLSLIKERFPSSKSEQSSAESLLEKIVYGAEGVFLWAVTAVRSLRDGLQDFATLSELQAAIENLPLGVENLYIQMLSRIKPIYRQEAMRYLQITLLFSGDDFLDIITLYFIDAERCSTDMPLTYEKINAELIEERCSALRSRLLSHTLGLLDISPENNKKSRFTCVIGIDNEMVKEPARLLRSRISFHHRTVKEFLLENGHAQELITSMGLKEHEIHLAIARGIMCLCIHNNQGNRIMYAPTASDFRNLRSAFHHISILERTLGTAQSRLLHSLCAHISLVMSQTKREFPGFQPVLMEPSEYDLDPGIDVIGMLAGSGMLRYIGEVLGLQASEPQMDLECPQKYPTPEDIIPSRIEWIGFSRFDLQPLEYRQNLSKYLRWSYLVDWANEQIKSEKTDGKLVETYILYWCNPQIGGGIKSENLLLPRILLRAGADPMVEVWPTRRGYPKTRRSFWVSWIQRLGSLWTAGICNLCQNCTFMTNLDPSTNLCKISTFSDIVPEDSSASLDDLWQTTMALLARGVNYDQPTDCQMGQHCFKRVPFHLKDWMLDVYTSPIYILELYFNDYSEFREFVASTRSETSSGAQRRRTLASIRPMRAPEGSAVGLIKSIKEGYWLSVDVTKEQEEMFWDAVVRWEESGLREDEKAIESMLIKIWDAYWLEHKNEEEHEEKRREEV